MKGKGKMKTYWLEREGQAGPGAINMPDQQSTNNKITNTTITEDQQKNLQEAACLESVVEKHESPLSDPLVNSDS